MTNEQAASTRDRYNAFIERHETAWELTMAGIALVWIVLTFLDRNTLVDALIVALTLVLWVEFGTRLVASHDRKVYLLDEWHWIDGVALIPLTQLRWLRLVRLVRVFGGVFRALVAIESLHSSRRLLWLFFAWLCVAFICSAVLFAYESGVNPEVADAWDAAYWGVVTLTTVGYGDVTPVTTEGRASAAILMLLGITLFAAITGTITSRFVSADHRADAEDVATRLRAAAALHEEGVLTTPEFEAKKAELMPLL